MKNSSSDRSANHLSAVRRLKSLFEATAAARPILLLGAGASYRAGVPLADEAVRRIAREVCAQRSFGTHNVSRVKPGDIMRFLQEQHWFIQEPERFAENFPLAVEHLLVPSEYRRDFFLRELRPVNGLSEGYRALARLAQRGLWRTALTTNFDSCIVDAINTLSPHLRRAIEFNKDPISSTQPPVYGHNPQIIYLHGAVETYSDKNTIREIAELPKVLVDALKPFLASSPLVVVGYRGSEPSIMEGLFAALQKETNNFASGVYWCDLGRQPLHSKVLALQEALSTNFIELVIDGFDELFEDLNNALKAEDIYTRPSSALVSSPLDQVPADEHPIAGATYEDLDHDFMLATLTTYCEKVGRPNVERHTMSRLLLEQGLVAQVNGELIPTVGGMLLFGRDVQKWFPQACVELTFAGKKRQIVRGNLIQQFKKLIDILCDRDVNPELRIKTDTSSYKRLAYHPRSLTEMVVNLLVHRDYAIEIQSRIDIYEGQLIRFSNPGGLSENLLEELAPDEAGVFAPRRATTSLRNGAIADVFFGLGPMDKRGSGLCDAIELMQEQGGAARYAVQSSNTHFVAELLQARQAAPGKSDTAVALHPYGIYITNHLRFKLLPRTVTVIENKLAPPPVAKSGRDLLGEDQGNSPVFALQKERWVSFNSGATLGLARLMPRVSDLDYFISQPGGHNAVSHLLRAHFVRHLEKFKNDGLFVEPSGHRAYFVKVGEETPKIRYNTAKRQGIVREMVKQREIRGELYHENEGIAFDIVRFDSGWAVEIKPFYMFTAADGVTPLPGWRRGRLSTSRIRFDRNQAVRSDLGFWSRYLGQENPVVQLSPSTDYDLMLEGAFHELEVVDASQGESK